ncbi:hypothetical protein D9M71_199550 [compost metagenome]
MSAGTVVPAMLMPALKSSSLTSGATFRLMRCGSTTVGVSVSRTPNSLYSMPTLSPVAFGTGTGNSPPARKLALCPLRATRLGLARV